MVMLTFMDQVRSLAGCALDSLGLGATETPYRIIAEPPGARLRAYQPPRQASGPALLIIASHHTRALGVRRLNCRADRLCTRQPRPWRERQAKLCAVGKALLADGIAAPRKSTVQCQTWNPAASLSSRQYPAEGGVVDKGRRLVAPAPPLRFRSWARAACPIHLW
jgi:hypothetical protein